MQSTIIFPFPTLNLKYRYAVDCNNSRCNWCALLECFAVYFVMSTVEVVCIIMSCATQFFASFSRYSNSIFITLPSMPFISIHRKTNRVRFHRYTLNTSCAHSINSIFFSVPQSACCGHEWVRVLGRITSNTQYMLWCRWGFIMIWIRIQMQQIREIVLFVFVDDI